ncbi:hypothetical protein LIER_43025 [Lithospermum erythrorhizon]|uniref:Uncharacterized protein n=1 Tax=Lithospermum erythrorhizon TaxID=34254 RepID=A0AAV3PC43_LITER
MGPSVPISWTIKDEAGSLSIRDTTFIQSQIQALRKAIPVKPTWTTYCEEIKVWETNQNPSDPTEVDIAATKGRRFPRFNSQLVIHKPLVSGSGPIPVFLAKRSTSFEVPASTSKCTKVEALENINAPSLTPTTSHTEEIARAKKKKYAKRCSMIEAELEKVKRDQALLANDVEDSRSTTMAATKSTEATQARARKAEQGLKIVDAEMERSGPVQGQCRVRPLGRQTILCCSRGVRYQVARRMPAAVGFVYPFQDGVA